MALLVSMLLTLVTVVRTRRSDPEAWQDLTRRGGWTWKFSRLDVLVYGHLALAMVYAFGMAIFRVAEGSEQTERNTKHMGDAVGKMRETSDQSLLMLAAMREEAEAARQETAAAQRLAIWVGVGTAVVAALLGGVAGAFAADVIGS